MSKQYEALAILCLARETVDEYASMRVGMQDFARYAERELTLSVRFMANASVPGVKSQHARATARCCRYERNDSLYERDQCLALYGLIRDCLAAWLGDEAS